MLDYFFSLNTAVLKFLSLEILARTFFKPWKNEYREGLVGFAVFMGIFIKSMIIFFDLLILVLFISVEISMIFLFVSFPVITIGLFII